MLSNTNTDSDKYAFPDPNSHSNADENPDAYANSNSNADSYTNSDYRPHNMPIRNWLRFQAHQG